MEEDSPYRVSKTPPGRPSDSWVIEIPQGLTRPIKHMWILLVVMSVLALVAGLGMLITNRNYGPFLAAALSLVALMYGVLAIGVYKRIRLVAAGVVGICVISLLGALTRAIQGDVSLIALGFAAVSTFVSVRGTMATYAFHRFVADARQRPPGPRLSDDPAFADKTHA